MEFQIEFPLYLCKIRDYANFDNFVISASYICSYLMLAITKQVVVHVDETGGLFPKWIAQVSEGTRFLAFREPFTNID